MEEFAYISFACIWMIAFNWGLWLVFKLIDRFVKFCKKKKEVNKNDNKI